MKAVRFLHDGSVQHGIVEGNTIHHVSGSIYGEYSVTEKKCELEEVKILPPCEPSKIVAIGLNYRDHAKEVEKKLPEEPMLFLKPPTSIIGHEDPIVYPESSKRVDYEAELALIIKEKIKNISREAVPGAILGYTCFNDVTARDIQSRSGQFTRSKSFDTFAPIGPFIITDIDPHNVDVKSILNGEVRQSSNTKHLIALQ